VMQVYWQVSYVVGVATVVDTYESLYRGRNDDQPHHHDEAAHGTHPISHATARVICVGPCCPPMK
jgi:hypothetical protein